MEYRKAEKWYVIHEGKTEDGNIVYCRQSTFERYYTSLNKKIFFKGTEEECKKWIEEHKNKTWLEVKLKEKKSSTEYTRTELDMYELGYETGIVEVCEKILKEFEEKLPFYIDTGKNCLLKDIKSIIEDLGIVF